MKYYCFFVALSLIYFNVFANDSTVIEYSIKVQTVNYEFFRQKLDDKIKKFDIQIVTEKETQYSLGKGYTATFYIKELYADTLISELNGDSAQVINKTKRQTNIKQATKDIWQQLNKKYAVQDHYNKLLKNAKTAQDTEQLKKLIDQLVLEIQALEAKKQRFEQPDISTVAIDVTQIKPANQIISEESDFIDLSLIGISNKINIFLIYVLPLIGIGIVIYIFYKVKKEKRRRQRSRRRAEFLDKPKSNNP